MEKPQTVTHAALLWTTAVLAGILETVLAVSEIARESGIDGGTWTQVGLRAAVYAAVLVLVASFAAGRRWARWGLAGLLSVIGLASMVVPAVTAMGEGEVFLAAFGGDGEFRTAFFVVRMVHIAAVVAATLLMFSPSANAHFRGRREAVAS